MRHGFHRSFSQLTFLAAFSAVCVLAGCSQPQSGSTASASTNPPAKPAAPEKQPEPEKQAKYTFEKPEYVRGIYVTAWTAGGNTRMENLLNLVDRTELNAMVIDVRDSGEMYWKTGIELAEKSGANHIAVVNPDKVFQRLQKHKVYPIARISCFRDEFVPVKFPERAVQTPNGKPWADRSGHEWLDPYNKKNWEYLAETVEWALDQGFPEIQLDYVRFPSEGKSSTQRFPARKSYPNPDAKPGDVIKDFCEYIGEKVRKRGGVFSADIFGIISSGTVDQGIGQDLEKIAGPFDLICPMVYPSHFAKGEYKVADPNRAPYEIVLKSLRDYQKRLPNKKVRPWLQDFSLFGVRYGAKEVQAQIKAAKELGYEEYLLWNAQNRYTEAAVKDNSALVKAKPKTSDAETTKPEGAPPVPPAPGGRG